MTERPEPSGTAHLRAWDLANDVPTAETEGRAMDRILEAIGEVMVPDIIITVDRTYEDDEPALTIIRCEGAPDVIPTRDEENLGLEEARAALDRYDALRDAAAAKGAPVRNPGTAARVVLPSLAKVLWSGDRVFGVVVLLRRNEVFTDEERKLFNGITTLASESLDRREIHAPRAIVVPESDRDPRVEAEKRHAKTRRIASADQRKFGADADACFLGQSEAHRKILDDVQQLGGSDLTVLIQGESGTGKEVIARLLHRASPWASGPFIAVNLAAIRAELFESAIFGHKKGSFTGALIDSPGFIGAALNGTLFLDEIGELSLDLQAKLLRVLQEKKVARLGDSDEHAVRVRFLCATNRDLAKDVKAGRFRKDLFFRLAQVPITLPPLRDRMRDVTLLVRHFVGARPLDPGVFLELSDHDWPGNVRELKLVLESAMARAGDGKTITRDHIIITTKKRRPRTLAEALSALKRRRGNITRASKDLNIDRKTLKKILGTADEDGDGSADEDGDASA